MQFEASFEPAAFAGLAFRKGSVYRVEGDVLAIADTDRPGRNLMELDRRTGRLIRFVTGDPLEGRSVMSFEAGAFAKARADFLAIAAECRERYRPEAPLQSVVPFFADFLVTKKSLELIAERDLPAGELLAGALRAKAVDVVRAVKESFYVPASSDFLKKAPPLGAMFAPAAWSSCIPAFASAAPRTA